MKHVRMFGAIVLSLSLATGCGAAGGTSAETAAATNDAEWTSSQLRKLDPMLRTRVRDGADQRIAVKVYFYELPTDAELADLLLNRMGEQAIGELQPDALHRLAARRDVERIEPLSDVGYALD